MLKILLKFSAQSFLIFIVIITIGGFGHFFIVEPTEVEGRSMENFLFDKDIIVIEKMYLLFSSPRRGQTISVLDEENNILLVKRIVALPGETVTIRDGKIFLINANGTEWQLEENYLSADIMTLPANGEATTSYPTLAKNEYFIMGDNREHSTDSRNYGPVHRNKIVGVVRKLFSK
ncbi:MAG: signal peptidase I [Patescibacteria group bacterium]